MRLKIDQHETGVCTKQAVKEIECERLDRIKLAEDRVQ
jgi:hypothetical protein